MGRNIIFCNHMKNIKPTIQICLLWAVFAFTQMSLGDIIVLTTGNEIFGEVLSQDTVTIKIKAPAATMEFPSEKVVRVVTESPGYTHSKFGKYYLERKMFEKAMEYYKLALKDEPGKEDYQSKLDLCIRQLKEDQKSQAEKVIEQADQLIEQGRLDDALGKLSDVTTKAYGESIDHKALQEMSKIYLIQATKATEAADRETLVRQAIATDGESAAAHYELGMIYLQNKNPITAKEQFDMSVTLDPGYVKAYRHLGNFAFDTGEFLKAAEYYEKIRNLSPEVFSDVKPNLTICYIELGNDAFDHKNYDEAKTWLERGLDLDPRGNWTLLFKTQYYLRLKEIDTTSPLALFNMALWCLDKNMDTEALDQLRAALKIDPNFFKAKQKMREINDKLATTLYQIGIQNMGNRNYNLAIANFSKIVDEYPESSFTADARRLMQLSREQWAVLIYMDADASFKAGYFDRAYNGFNKIIQDFSDTNKFVDAQRMIARTKGRINEKESGVTDRSRKLDEFNKMVESSSPSEQGMWNRIKSLAALPQREFESNIMNLSYQEKSLIRNHMDKVAYLFYNPDVKMDKLGPLAVKFSLPLREKGKIRSESDYLKLLQYALLILISRGDEYYDSWLELSQYFGTSQTELQEAKSGLSAKARDLIDSDASEVYRILNLRR
jgi:tetratricopeptide (TPR) repeat protein